MYYLLAYSNLSFDSIEMTFGSRNEINHHMSLVLEFLEDSSNIILQYPALSGPDSHRLVLTHIGSS